MSDSGLPPELVRRAEIGLGSPLPQALREWYFLAGRRPDLTSGQNRLLAPDHLQLTGDILVHQQENQGVVVWGTHRNDWSNPDPPVYVSIDYSTANPSWLQESESFTEFVLRMLIFETVLGYEHSFWTEVSQAQVALLTGNLKGFGYSDWHWPEYPTRFFGSDDVLIVTSGESQAWVAARTRPLLAEVLAPIGIRPEGPG
jgi:hypothetical protein